MAPQASTRQWKLEDHLSTAQQSPWHPFEGFDEASLLAPVVALTDSSLLAFQRKQSSPLRELSLEAKQQKSALVQQPSPIHGLH